MQVPLLDLRQQYQTIREQVRAAILRVTDEQSLILGPHVEHFERRLADYCAVRHAVGVSSGTDALLVAMMAAGIGPGDEVICPSFTFFATAGCVARLGATPVFADIDPATFNINPDLVERLVTSRTKAIVPVDLFGQVCQIDRINEIACRNNLLVIEDAAQAIGAKRNNRPATSTAWVGALSFYPTKNLGAFGDAGAVCTNDDVAAETIRKLRVHGSGHTYHHELIGGMFRLAAIQAAVLNVKLDYLDQWHNARRRHAAIYDERIAGSAVITPRIEPENSSVFNQYVVRVNNRDAVRQQLTDHGIGTGVYYPLGLHQQPCFDYLNYNPGDLPETELAAGQVLALPIYPELTDDQIHHVATTLLRIVDRSDS